MRRPKCQAPTALIHRTIILRNPKHDEVCDAVEVAFQSRHFLTTHLTPYLLKDHPHPHDCNYGMPPDNAESAIPIPFSGYEPPRFTFHSKEDQMRTIHGNALRLISLIPALILFFTAFPTRCHAQVCNIASSCNSSQNKQVCFNDNGTITCGGNGLTYDKTLQTLSCQNLTATTISVPTYLTLSTVATAVGSGAGHLGAGNTSLGINALYTNTGGIYNVAVGYVAMYATNSNNGGGNGSDNVAVGSFALQNNITGYQNVAIGTDAMQANIIGNGNVAIGLDAMNATNGRTGSDGSNNVAVGKNALLKNILGNSNVAVGMNALEYNNGDGSNNQNVPNNNTAVGFGAMSSNYSGYEDTAVGNTALLSNTSGTGLVAVGSKALTANTTGNNNTALGSSAMYYVTGASNNTAVGMGALYSAQYTSGSCNTAVGSQALVANNSGSYNTATGHLSLWSNWSGSYNSAFGREALYANYSGAYNSAFGMRSLYNNSTGSGNIAIGYYAGYNEMGSNSFYLSNQAQNSNSDERNYSLLYGTFAQNPQSRTGQQLTVNGKLNVSGDASISGAFYDSSKGAGTSGQVLQSTGTGIQWTTGIGKADTVDSFHASSTASANTLLPLNASTKFPNSVLYMGSGNGLDADLLDGQNGSYYQNAANINSGTLAVAQGGTGQTSPGMSGNVLTSNGTTWVSSPAGWTISGNNEYAAVSGNVGIGTSTPNYQLQLSTDSAAKPLTNTWTIASDRRLKKDIAPFTDGLDVIEKINPIRYRYNGLAGMPRDMEGIGVIAQEIQKVAPYTVGTFKAKLDENAESESELYDFNSHALTFVLINAVKELDERTKGLAGKTAREPVTSEVNPWPNPLSRGEDLRPAEAGAKGTPATAGQSAVLEVADEVLAGEVVVIVPSNGAALHPCYSQADALVVGIALADAANGRAPVAAGGFAYVKADATLAPIAKGDLLVTSPTPGHAMKAQPTMVNGFPMYQSGTVLGKALEPLDSGTGLIKVIVLLR